MNYLYVACGGAIGAVLRYVLSTTIMGLLKDASFPFGTMTVNLIGCFFIGLIMGLAEFRGAVGNDGRLFLVVGCLGGFTTFSSFGYETIQLLRQGETMAALANVAMQNVFGLALVWVGNVVARLW